LYSMIAVCLGVICILLVVIFHLRRSRTRSTRRRILHSSSSNSDQGKKFSSRTYSSAASTQTAPENEALLPADSPDHGWVQSPTPGTGRGYSTDGPSPRLADPSSSPSMLRSLPVRAHSRPATVGDSDPVWMTLERDRPRSPNADLYTNPYRHDAYRTIDSRASKSPRR